MEVTSRCEHGESGVDAACGGCLDAILAKEFELGRRAGRTQGLNEASQILRARAGELFLARKDDEARMMRVLYEVVDKLIEEK